MDEFYGSAVAYSAYHAARGRDVSDQSVDEIETALLVASEWLDGSFANRWPGYITGTRLTQYRSWPRSDVIDIHGYGVDYSTVPVEIEYATYEAAYRWLADNTALLADYTPQKYKSVSIDGALSVQYRMLDAATVQQQFPIIGNILSRLLGGSATSSLSSGMVRV